MWVRLPLPAPSCKNGLERAVFVVSLHKKRRFYSGFFERFGFEAFFDDQEWFFQLNSEFFRCSIDL